MVAKELDIAVTTGNSYTAAMTAQATLKAAKMMGIDAEFCKVTEIKKIMEYGAMLTPALAINGKIVSVGRVLNPDEIKKLILKEMGNPDYRIYG